MDIDLLSKMVKELILDNDEVALPGVGSFVAEYVPATFSDRGFTINPPYKRLSFRNKISENSTGLVNFYAKCNGLDTDTASKILTEFLSELRNVLESKKVVIFPSLGKLRATKENYFFFVADEDLDIYPEGFGLEPVSLKTHEESPAEVSATMSALRSILNPEEVVEDEPVLTVAADDSAAPAAETGAAGVAGVADSAVVTTEMLADADNVAAIDNVANIATADDAAADTDEEALAQPTALAEKSETTDGDDAAGSEVEIPVESPVKNRENAETGKSCEISDSIENVNDSGNEVIIAAEEAVEENAESSDKASSAEPQTTTGPADAEPVTAVSDVKPVAVIDKAKSSDNESAEKKSLRKNTGWKVLLWIMVALIALAVTALVAFIVLAHTAPDFIDSLLYTPEELDILNWPLSNPE